MKKSTVSVGLLTILLSSGVSAGTMGSVVQPSFVKPFVGVEGGYTWTQTDGLNFNYLDNLSLHSTENTKMAGSGRVYAGLSHELSDIFAVTGEIGGGYYGNTKYKFVRDPQTVALDDLNIKSSQYGFDILAGLMYTQPSYDLFLKAGAMVQNSRLSVNSSLPANGSLALKTNETEILPEIKLGGAYHLTEQLALTASWAHVFGSTQKASLSYNPTSFSSAVHVNLQNPTLDSAMVGLQYRFG
jgi:hypothetical protein